MCGLINEVDRPKNKRFCRKKERFCNKYLDYYEVARKTRLKGITTPILMLTARAELDVSLPPRCRA